MKFIVIGITDNPNPWFPPEVMETIKQGRVFSGGKRHHEIVLSFLPVHKHNVHNLDLNLLPDPLDHIGFILQIRIQGCPI